MTEPNACCPTDQNSCLTFLQLARKVRAISRGQVAASGSYNHSSDHEERPSEHLCWPQMETPDQYHEYAAECFRLASKSKTEADRETLLELARAWKKVAEEAEAET